MKIFGEVHKITFQWNPSDKLNLIIFYNSCDGMQNSKL